MAQKNPPSKAINQFRENIENLLYVDFTIGTYKGFVEILKNTKEEPELKEVLDKIIQADDKEVIYNLLYVNLVTILEVYLKDRVLEKLENNPIKIETFLKEYKFDRKMTVEDVLLGPKAVVENFLNNMVFHNINRVDTIYKAIFGFNIIQFCDYKRLDFIIKSRHEIVHNGGYINNKKIRVTPTGFGYSCKEISNFVEGIDYYCRFHKKRVKFPRLYLKHHEKWDKLLEWREYYNASYQVLFSTRDILDSHKDEFII